MISEIVLIANDLLLAVGYKNYTYLPSYLKISNLVEWDS